MKFCNILMNTTSFNTGEGIIYQSYVGDQTQDTIEQAAREIMPLVEASRKNTGKVLIIVNVSQLGAFDFGAKRAALKAIGPVKFDKLALVGASESIPFLVQVIMTQATHERFSTFETEEDARVWVQL